jgi:hypothetical protein
MEKIKTKRYNPLLSKKSPEHPLPFLAECELPTPHLGKTQSSPFPLWHFAAPSFSISTIARKLSEIERLLFHDKTFIMSWPFSWRKKAISSSSIKGLKSRSPVN